MRVFLAGSAASSVGLEITRTELHAGMFDIAGRALSQMRMPVRDFEDAALLLDDAAALILRRLLDRNARATAYMCLASAWQSRRRSTTTDTSCTT